MTWWITDTSIGQRLKFVRRFRRLTQKELGLLMGYSEKTADVRIAQYEKNARTPNAETTAKLAEVLKVSPAVFSPTICASREDLLQSMYMTADSDAVEYTLFYQIICCGTTDTQNVLNLIDRIGSFVIADRILFIKAVQFRNSCFKHKNASFIR